VILTAKEDDWMTKWRVLILFAVSLSLAMTVAFQDILPASEAKDIPRMTKEELKPMLGSPDVVVVDVRTASEWDGSDLKVKGAIREDPKKVNSWADKYPKDKTLVFY
jgi:hypothetical protein